MLVSLIDKRLAELVTEQAMLTELKAQLEPFERRVIELCSPVRVSHDQVVGTVKQETNHDQVVGTVKQETNGCWGDRHLLVVRRGETRLIAMRRHLMGALNELPKVNIQRITLKNMIIPDAPSESSRITLFTRALRELVESEQIKRSGHGLYCL